MINMDYTAAQWTYMPSKHSSCARDCNTLAESEDKPAAKPCQDSRW